MAPRARKIIERWKEQTTGAETAQAGSVCVLLASTAKAGCGPYVDTMWTRSNVQQQCRFRQQAEPIHPLYIRCFLRKPPLCNISERASYCCWDQILCAMLCRFQLFFVRHINLSSQNLGSSCILYVTLTFPHKIWAPLLLQTSKLLCNGFDESRCASCPV